jgi:HPt (histidine-containing phosphotransfer) domain-containing protein
MMAAPPAAFLEMLERKRLQYGESLPGKMADMERLWVAIRTGAGRADLDRLERMAHGLAGSGALFGFEPLSAQARALELELADAPSGGPLPQAREAAIATAMARVRACARGSV